MLFHQLASLFWIEVPGQVGGGSWVRPLERIDFNSRGAQSFNATAKE